MNKIYFVLTDVTNERIPVTFHARQSEIIGWEMRELLLIVVGKMTGRMQDRLYQFINMSSSEIFFLSLILFGNFILLLGFLYCVSR